jgi:predicted nucleic acid-binding Zn ribbon protein
MERVGDQLQQLLARLNLEAPIQGWRAVDLWPDVVGPKVAARARAVSFRDGILTVSVESAAWMSELTYLRHRLVQELNRRLEGQVVREIRIQLGGSGASSPDKHGER